MFGPDVDDAFGRMLLLHGLKNWPSTAQCRGLKDKIRSRSSCNLMLRRVLLGVQTRQIRVFSKEPSAGNAKSSRSATLALEVQQALRQQRAKEAAERKRLQEEQEMKARPARPQQGPSKAQYKRKRPQKPHSGPREGLGNPCRAQF